VSLLYGTAEKVKEGSVPQDAGTDDGKLREMTVPQGARRGVDKKPVLETGTPTVNEASLGEKGGKADIIRGGFLRQERRDWFPDKNIGSNFSGDRPFPEGGRPPL